MPPSLTELEGAVLSEIHHRGHTTAFQVRRAFQDSPSVEWSGSAGAVYPAIKRMIDNGLIDAERETTGRRTAHLSVTAHGLALLDDWIADVPRAIGVGLDPFRLRSGLWAHLPPDRRRGCLDGMLDALTRQIAEMEAGQAALDPIERRRSELALILQRARRDWLRAELRL